MALLQAHRSTSEQFVVPSEATFAALGCAMDGEALFSRLPAELSSFILNQLPHELRVFYDLFSVCRLFRAMVGRTWLTIDIQDECRIQDSNILFCAKSLPSLTEVCLPFLLHFRFVALLRSI